MKGAVRTNDPPPVSGAVAAEAVGRIVPLAPAIRVRIRQKRIRFFIGQMILGGERPPVTIS
ncbi:MAG TPA: hypothetical protein VGY32_08860 [Solirubrobacteraceae bacterium]|nr:hypothetical protein [Solirubrobacteraceae bacterium]